MINQDLLDVLVCPATKNRLYLASSEELENLNNSIKSKQLINLQGEIVTEALVAALITVDCKTAYPIRNGIPIMLIEQGIKISTVGS